MDAEITLNLKLATEAFDLASDRFSARHTLERSKFSGSRGWSRPLTESQTVAMNRAVAIVMKTTPEGADLAVAGAAFKVCHRKWAENLPVGKVGSHERYLYETYAIQAAHTDLRASDIARAELEGEYIRNHGWSRPLSANQAAQMKAMCDQCAPDGVDAMAWAMRPRA